MIEQIYSTASDQEKREIIFAFYGNYYYLLKELEGENQNKAIHITLKEFLEKKT